MSENPNLYKFEEDPNLSPQKQQSGMNIPVDSLKDIGGIPLPKNEEMGKWLIVVSVIVVLAALWFIGSWINDEMQFKNDQIKNCNANFQDLNVKYILKDQELQQLKTQTGYNQSIQNEVPQQNINSNPQYDINNPVK